jgi:hypothetical protein
VSPAIALPAGRLSGRKRGEPTVSFPLIVSVRRLAAARYALLVFPEMSHSLRRESEESRADDVRSQGIRAGVR